MEISHGIDFEKFTKKSTRIIAEIDLKKIFEYFIETVLILEKKENVENEKKENLLFEASIRSSLNK